MLLETWQSFGTRGQRVMSLCAIITSKLFGVGGGGPNFEAKKTGRGDNTIAPEEANSWGDNCFGAGVEIWAAKYPSNTIITKCSENRSFPPLIGSRFFTISCN